MKQIKRWDDSLSVGVKNIDNQHKILFDLANDLNNAIHNGSNMQVIDTLFAVIMNYAFKHFATEEDYFHDQNDFSRHCYQHYQLLKQINDYTVDYRNGRNVTVEPGEFLENWLLKHIKECDVPSLSIKEIDLSSLGIVDAPEDFDRSEIDQRQHKRVRYDRVLDEDIYGHCYNANTLKTGTVTVVDLASGGLKIYAEQKYDVDDLLIISCKVGRNFRMREKVRVRSANDNFYGVEFVSPAEETVRFLTELSGAVHSY